MGSMAKEKMKKKKGRHGQAGEGRERVPLGELLARRFDIPADLFAGKQRVITQPEGM